MLINKGLFIAILLTHCQTLISSAARHHGYMDG